MHSAITRMGDSQTEHVIVRHARATEGLGLHGTRPFVGQRSLDLVIVACPPEEQHCAHGTTGFVDWGPQPDLAGRPLHLVDRITQRLVGCRSAPAARRPLGLDDHQPGGADEQMIDVAGSEPEVIDDLPSAAGELP